MSFLDNLFTATEFPYLIGKEIVIQHRHQYLARMVKNESLVCHAAEMIEHVDLEGAVALAGANDLACLGALLDSKECRFEVLETLRRRWMFTLKDQERFLARELDQRIIDQILGDTSFSYDVHEAVRSRASETAQDFYKRRLAALRQAGTDPRRDRFHYPGPSTYVGVDSLTSTIYRHVQCATPQQALASSPYHMAALSSNNELSAYALSSGLRRKLGDGAEEDDLARWNAFIYLVSGGPLLSIDVLLDASVDLVRASMAVPA